MLGIFKVTGTREGYNAALSFVVICEDEAAARRTWHAPEHAIEWCDERREWVDMESRQRVKYYHASTWDPHIETLTVRHLGTANPGARAGVVCRDFVAS